VESLENWNPMESGIWNLKEKRERELTSRIDGCKKRKKCFLWNSQSFKSEKRRKKTAAW
jgi:hypothetical protein